jgi:hypothetical protein
MTTTFGELTVQESDKTRKRARYRERHSRPRLPVSLKRQCRGCDDNNEADAGALIGERLTRTRETR